MIKQKVLTLLVLLAAVVTGARAAWTGGTYTATANENLNAITVSDDATLTINQGVTVTVSGGIVVADGKTLTITGGGTLVANGANGANGGTGQTGNAGGTAIAGNVIINGVGLTVTATGGQGGQGGQGAQGGKGSDGSDGEGGEDGGLGGDGARGGDGGSAFSGAVTIYAGSVTATGGKGGNGGKGGTGGTGGTGGLGSDGGQGGQGGDGGNGGNGGHAFAGTLTVYGGNVSAYGGQEGNGGEEGDGGYGGEGGFDGYTGELGDIGEMSGDDGDGGVAYANNVTFEAATYTVKDDSGYPINLNNITSELKVIIQSADVEPVVPYSVALADGTEDATNWTITPAEATTTGVAAGTEVKATYSGTKHVKSVKAVKKAAAPSVPDGAINGKFSVSESKQVYFSKGNLRYASGTWSFFDNQYDIYSSYSADTWDKFGWSTSTTDYGMNTSTSNNTFSGEFVDWGGNSDLQTALGTGWFTLSSAEWTYLFDTRSASTVGGTANGRYAKAKVNDEQGIILFPDTYTHPDGVTAPTGVNATGNTGWNGNNYSSADWTKMESAGCVFLPAAGRRSGSTVSYAGAEGYYWSATPYSTTYSYYMYFTSGDLEPARYNSRRLGCSVRLVRQVTE